MDMKPVSSSQIVAIGHDPAAKLMRVEFKTGGTYEYSGVPTDVAQKVMGAPSIGSAHHELIKKGGYAHTKV